VLQAVGTVSDT